MDTAAFAELARNLPRVAEEGPDRESIPEVVLADRITPATGGRPQAETLLATVRRQFLALALLDEDICSRGEWQFVSFAASLCARSLLAGLANREFRVFEKGFWEPAEFRVDRQRELLHRLELLRRDSSPNCFPIRRVWVAWALLASDGKFLMVAREDGRANRVGTRGKYVFPGGKVSSVDLSGMTTDQRLAFFDPNVEESLSEALPFLTKAFARELDEELELDSHSLRSTAAVGPPINYVALEGAGSSHAQTEYFIQPFRIELTEIGKEKMLRVLARYPERFCWFSRAEIIAGKNAQNQTAFVDALKQLDEGKLDVLLNAEHNDVGFGSEKQVTDAIEIPRSSAEPFRIGVTGREKSVLVQLDDAELADITFLAALRRGESTKELADQLTIVPSLGWLVIDDDKLLQRAQTLSAKMREELPGISILATVGRAVRFNVADRLDVLFSGKWMSLEAEDQQRGKSYRLRVERHEIRSGFGVAERVAREGRASEMLGRAINELLAGDLDFTNENLDTVKKMQRTELKEFLSKVGLRLLVRQEEGVPVLAVKRASVS